MLPIGMISAIDCAWAVFAWPGRSGLIAGRMMMGLRSGDDSSACGWPVLVSGSGDCRSADRHHRHLGAVSLRGRC